MTDLKQKQSAYWTQLETHLHEVNPLVRKGSLEIVQHDPAMHKGVRFGLGRKVQFELLANMGKHRSRKGVTGGIPAKAIAIDLRIDKPLADHATDEILENLKRDRAAIEDLIGATLQWPDSKDIGDQKRQVVILVDRDHDPNEIKAWNEQHAWFSRNLEKFYEAFVPRLERMESRQVQANS